MFPSPFNTKRLLFNEDSISKQEQSTPNASQAEISLPLVKKSNPDELVSWIDSLESRVKDTLRHQNNELEQFNVEHEREKAKQKYRYAVFEQSFQKLGNIVQNNRLDSDAESTTEANNMNIDETDSNVGGETQESQEVSEDKSDIEENVVSDDSDIIEIIESEEEGDQSEEEQEIEQDEPEADQNEEDVLFEINSQPSYSKPRLMDDRKYMSGPFSSHTREPEEDEHESEIESEIDCENEVMESEVEDESNEGVSVSDRENESDEMAEVQHSADSYIDPENHQQIENEDFQAEEQNPSFHSYHANAIDVNFLHNHHEPESYEGPAAHTNHDLNNYFTSEYNHADDDDVDAGIHDYGTVHTHMDLPSNSEPNPHNHDESQVSVMVEEITSTLENENDDNNDDDNMHNSDVDSDAGSDAGSDEDEEQEESENDHEVPGQMDNAPLEKSVLESIASFMTNANNVHKNETFEPESVNTNLDEHKQENLESETNSHLDEQDYTAMNAESETLLQNEERQDNIAIESESEEESNSPPPLIFRTLLEHEPEEVLDQLKETEKRFNIKLNVVSAMEKELSRVSGLLSSHSQNADSGLVEDAQDEEVADDEENADDEMAAAIQEAIESSQTNVGEDFQADSELEAIQNHEIQAVLDSVEHQIGREEREEAGETAGEVDEHVSEVPLPHIEKPILEAVPPGPEETYIDATTELDAEVDDTEKTSLSYDFQPNVDQKSEHETTDILGSESENNERVSILKGPSFDGNEPENKTFRDLKSTSENTDMSTIPEDTISLHGNALEEDVSRISQSQDIEKRSFSENIQPIDDANPKIKSSSFLQSSSEDKATSKALDDQPSAGEISFMDEASRSQSEEIEDKPTTVQFQLISENESNTLQSQAETKDEDTVTEVQQVEHLETENTFEVQPDEIEVTDEIRMDEEEEFVPQNSASIIPQSVELDVEMEEVNDDLPSGNIDPEANMEEEAVQKDAEDMAEELVGEVFSNEQQSVRESSAVDENVQMESSTITHETGPTLEPTEGQEEQLESNDLSIERNEVEPKVESNVEFEEENYVEIEVENEPEVELEKEVDNHEQSEENEEGNAERNDFEKEVETEPEVVLESKLEYQVENDVEDIMQTELENEPELAVKNEVESEVINEVESEVKNEIENEVNDTQDEVESKVDYEEENNVDNNVQSEVENDVEITDEVENEVDELETEAGKETDLGKTEPESSASVTVQGIVAGDEGLKYVEIEETVTEVKEVLYPSAVLEPFEEESVKENVVLDRLEAEEYFSNDDDEEEVVVALPSVIIEEGEGAPVSNNSEQSDEISFKQEEEIANDKDEAEKEKDNHGKSLEAGEAEDEINHSATELETEPEHTSGRKRQFEEVEEDKNLEKSTFKRFRTFVSSFFGKKRQTSSNQPEDISVPRIPPPTLSPVESETEVEEDSERSDAPINTEDALESEENDERSSSNSDAGANNEVNDSEAETEVSDEEDLKERKNRFEVQEDLESVPTVEAIQTLKKKHPRMLQGLDISEEMLQPSHSLRNGHTYGKPGSLESTPEEPKLRIPKRGMRRQNVPKLIDTSIRPDEDYPAFRTRSKSPLKRSLQEIISTEEDVIAPRRRSRRVAQREEKMKAPNNENDGMDDGKS